MTVLKRLLRGSQAQDLIEYTLILAFVVLASAGLFYDSGHGVQNVWKLASKTLNTNSSNSTNPPCSHGEHDRDRDDCGH